MQYMTSGIPENKLFPRTSPSLHSPEICFCRPYPIALIPVLDQETGWKTLKIHSKFVTRETCTTVLIDDMKHCEVILW